jgi:DNA-binding MarR family transcriptional regulator
MSSAVAKPVAPLHRAKNGGARRGRARNGGAQPALPLEELLTYRICILAKLMDRASAGELGRRYGLGVADWRLLAQLGVHSPATVRWLAQRMRVDRAEVSRAAAALIARNLARREVDPADARSVLLSATDAGRALYRAIMPRRVALHCMLLDALTAEEVAVLGTAVEKLTRLLDQREAAVARPVRLRRRAA